VACATTYCMLSTLEASEAVFPSVLEAVAPGKAIIDCATLTPERWDVGTHLKKYSKRFIFAMSSGV